MRSTRGLVRGGLVASALLGIVGCRTDLLKDPDVGRPGAIPARVEIMEGFTCPGQARVATAPSHCAWLSSSTRSLVESVVFRVVAHVGADGHPSGIQVVDG